MRSWWNRLTSSVLHERQEFGMDHAIRLDFAGNNGDQRVVLDIGSDHRIDLTLDV